jgi:small-conductance mechanosensitive channel
MTNASEPARRPRPIALPPRPSWPKTRGAIADSVLVGLGAVLTYWLTASILARAYSSSPTDDALGGLWAVLAAVFVMRGSYDKSAMAAVSRIAATLVSLVLCLAYLAFLPFHMWGLALLIGLSSLAATLIGRPEDSITAAITTTVVLIVAEVSPHDAWHEPILRLADTVIGVVIGLAAVWIAQRTVYRWQPDGADEPGAPRPGSHSGRLGFARRHSRSMPYRSATLFSQTRRLVTSSSRKT